jgi:hypothetical protein
MRETCFMGTPPSVGTGAFSAIAMMARSGRGHCNERISFCCTVDVKSRIGVPTGVPTGVPRDLAERYTMLEMNGVRTGRLYVCSVSHSREAKRKGQNEGVKHKC